MHRAHSRFDPARPFGAWARRIATNVALAHLKRRRPAAELPPDLAAEPAADPAVRGELAGRIEAAFRGLSARLRTVARLALIEEQPYQNIAEALGLSIGAVKTRVFRAVRILREELRDLEKNV